MSQQLQQTRGETGFIETSGGILTDQLVRKLRDENPNEDAVEPQTFALHGTEPASAAELEAEISEVWEDMIERWDEISRSNDVFEMDVSAVRNKWLLPLFKVLDFTPVYQQSNLEADGIEANLSHHGWDSPESVAADGDVRETSPPVLHMIRPDPDRRLGDGDHRGAVGRRKSPHDELQTYLNANTDVQWSVVSDGLTLRVLRDYYHTYARGYVEFDLESIFTNRSYADFRVLYRLVHASRFLPQDDDQTPLESLYQVALATGVKVGEDLQSNIVEALETLGNGFLTPDIRDALQEGGQDAEDQYYQDLLRIVYRLLFLMFAEQRGMMADRGDLYTEEYSINRLRTRAEERSGRDSNTDVWEGLQVTFDMVGHGVDEAGLHVPGYNGGLFDDERLEYVTEADCPNHALLEAIYNLTHVDQEGYQQRISYADLGVDEIGAVYESLLEFTPKYCETAIELEERSVSAGEFYLDDRGMERKETGSYYTKPELVDELIDSALKPVVDDRVDEDASPAAQEEALLSIDVCDPACGSGAFLIAANNYLGKRLAEIRSNSQYPDESTVREARRSVVQHCLYGVDLNPMAVELAKVSLWINSAVKNQPLSFLDHRIKQGNSLIGATPELIEQGVPVDAYETSSGRDWHIGNEVRKQVRSENSNLKNSDQVQAGLDWQYTGQADHVDLAEQLENLEEDAIDDVQRKAKIYENFEHAESLETERLAHDVWTAAFYWPLDGSAQKWPSPQNIERVRREAPFDLDDPSTDIERMCARARDVSETHSFFHWQLEFPLVYEGSSGFDCVIGNPPWDRVSVEAVEFFAISSPEIADADTKSERQDLIEDLEEENPSLYVDWKSHVSKVDNDTKFYKYSGRYPESSKGYVNTYALFSGFTTNNISGKGKGGLITPTGIATDSSTQDFFRKLVENRRLDSLFGFANKNRIFEDVHAQFNFCLLVIAGSEDSQEKFDLSFGLSRVDHLHDENRRYQLSRSDIELINPNTKNCPTFEDKGDAELTLNIYRNIGTLINENEEQGNPWDIRFSVMFNKSNDSGLFKKYEELSSEESQLESNNWIESGDEKYFPVYESKFFHQYDHRFATYEIDAEGKDLRDVATSEKDDPGFSVMPKYWLKEEDYNSKFRNSWHIALRNITNSTNERTVICSLLPDVPTVHSMNHILGLDAEEAALVMASMNSYVLDFVARQKVGNTNLSQFIIKQLPIPNPERFERLKFDNTPISEEIIQLVQLLACTAHDLEGYLDEAGVSSPYQFTQPADINREDIRFKLEALIAHVYGVEDDDFNRIFDTFEQTRDRDIDQHGHYRTRDEIKERFKEMQDDITTADEIPKQ